MMLSIKFSKKERSVDQRIEKATIGPSNVAFMWHHEGKDHVLGIPKTCLQTLIGSIKKDMKKPIPCNGPPNTDQRITAQIDGDCVQLDFAENGTAKTVRLSVKSLMVLKAFLSDR
jgi:hypothetical protein